MKMHSRRTERGRLYHFPNTIVIRVCRDRGLRQQAQPFTGRCATRRNHDGGGLEGAMSLPLHSHRAQSRLEPGELIPTSSPWLRAEHRPQTFHELPTLRGPLRTNNEAPTPTGS